MQRLPVVDLWERHIFFRTLLRRQNIHARFIDRANGMTMPHEWLIAPCLCQCDRLIEKLCRASCSLGSFYHSVGADRQAHSNQLPLCTATNFFILSDVMVVGFVPADLYGWNIRIAFVACIAGN